MLCYYRTLRVTSKPAFPPLFCIFDSAFLLLIFVWEGDSVQYLMWLLFDVIGVSLHSMLIYSQVIIEYANETATSLGDKPL